jgi:heptosyltransferase I
MKGIDNVEFITFDKSAGWRGLIALRRRMAGQRFPILLHMHASMRANLVSRMIHADRRIGFDRQRARDYQWLFTNERIQPVSNQHVLDGMLAFIEHLGLSAGNLTWDIPVTANDRHLAEEICHAPGPTCIISPCSSQRFRNFRNWSVDNYIALIDFLCERYSARIILTGGPTDTEKSYGQHIQSATKAPVLNLIGDTSLKKLLAIIDNADLVICPDSGPAHMATAVGTPVVGLYATSNRHRTGPYYSQHLVADRYPDAIRNEFHKSVDEVRWGQRVRDPDAMNLITQDDVRQKISLALNERPRPRSPAPDLA